jgi:polyisoprenoid-binding protein YceI
MILAVLVISATGNTVYAQENILKAENVHAAFFSETPAENIEANNYEGRGVLNVNTGDLMFVITIKQFEFEKSLMQKHFNKNYLESDKYPEASFEGMIVGWEGMPSSKKVYRVEGTLNMHGVSQEINEKASLEPSGEGLTGKSTFTVLLKDFDIEVPKLVAKKIAEEIEVSITAHFN